MTCESQLEEISCAIDRLAQSTEQGPFDLLTAFGPIILGLVTVGVAIWSVFVSRRNAMAMEKANQISRQIEEARQEESAYRQEEASRRERQQLGGILETYAEILSRALSSTPGVAQPADLEPVRVRLLQWVRTNEDGDSARDLIEWTDRKLEHDRQLGKEAIGLPVRPVLSDIQRAITEWILDPSSIEQLANDTSLGPWGPHWIAAPRPR